MRATASLLFVSSLVLAGCQSPRVAKIPLSSTTPAPSPIAITAPVLDTAGIESVRLGETLKAYLVGRYIDPADLDVMHEAHTIYRREAGANWNLAPNAPTVVPLGPVLAVADPVRTPNPLPAELEQKITEQNRLMAALVAQNETLAAELAKLGRDLVEIRAKSTPAPTPEEKK